MTRGGPRPRIARAPRIVTAASAAGGYRGSRGGWYGPAMRAPRLLEVQCPRCGAGLRIDPQARLVSCHYCQASSFVHLPNERAAPPIAPGEEGHGHIHVPPQAMKALGAYMALSVLAPIVVMLLGFGIVAVVIVVAVFGAVLRPTPRGTVSSSPGGAVTVTPSPAFPGASCFKAAACCKALVASTTRDAQAVAACDGLALLSGSECERQHAQLKASAAAVHAKCD